MFRELIDYLAGMKEQESLRIDHVQDSRAATAIPCHSNRGPLVPEKLNQGLFEANL